MYVAASPVAPFASGQRDRRGHVKARKTGTRRGFARGKHEARGVLGVRGDVGEIILRPTAQS
jgi:hypothetical protein